MTPFRAIAVFYQVATLHSVRAAAQALNVTPSAVSQQLRTLEEQLGTTLTTTRNRKLHLTEAGERYFELISDNIAGIEAATALIRGTPQSTTLTIRATPTIATKWLLPRIKGFLDENPSIDLRLDGTNEPTDFARDHVDLEIRHGIGRWPGLHVQPLATEHFLPVCSPDFAAAASLTANDITGLRQIRSVKAQIQWPDWFTAQGLTPPKAPRRLSFDRSHMAIDAAVQGLGIALESTLMMDDELRAGRLVIPVSNTPKMPITTQWLVCPPSHLNRRRIRKFLGWISQEARNWEIGKV